MREPGRSCTGCLHLNTRKSITMLLHEDLQVQESGCYKGRNSRHGITAHMGAIVCGAMESQVLERQSSRMAAYTCGVDSYLPRVRSLVIDYLRKLTGKWLGVAYFYCDYRDPDQQTAVNVVASLLKQLLMLQNTLPIPVTELFERYDREKMQAQLEELECIFSLACREFRRSYIVIDALDECDTRNRKSILGFLKKLGKWSASVLVTSRPHSQDIGRSLCPCSEIIIEASDTDIRKYLAHKIDEDDDIADLLDETLKQEVIRKIADGARGMLVPQFLINIQLVADKVYESRCRFLLPALQIQTVLEQTTRSEIRAAINMMPKGLGETFEETLKRIKRQSESRSKLAMRVLMWISHARRPLQLEELRQALAVLPGQANLDSENCPSQKSMVDTCVGLVTISHESSTLRLVHYSLQEYLHERRQEIFPLGERTVASACLTYLSFETFADGFCTTDKELEIRLERFPFLDYAARHWGHHLQSEWIDEFETPVLKFLTHQSNFLCSIQVMRIPVYHYKGYSQRFPKRRTGLHVAAYFGLESLSRRLLEEGTDIEAKDSGGWTALHEAAGNEQGAVVRLLLEKGANIEQKTNDGLTALHCAAEKGHDAVVRLLLGKGADVKAKDSWEWTALYRAAENGHDVVVQQLLENGADTEAKDIDFGRTTLYRAAANGHETVVQLLLENGADVEAKDTDSGRMALHRAAENGHAAVARLLLGNGADFEAKTLNGWTALKCAAENGHGAAVQLLLEHGADIEAKDSNGCTALKDAVENGQGEVVQQLLKHGADIEAKDNNGWTALHWAAGKGHPEILLLLLEKGADTEAKDSNGWTVLRRAYESGHQEVVQLLLEKGANIEAKDRNGWTVLHKAAQKGDQAVVLLLLEKGADVDNRANDESSTIQRAAERGHEEIVRLLLENGADVGAKDFDGWTPLHATAQHGYEGVMRLLLERGADVEAGAGDGWTALHWAAGSGREALIRLLVESGANIEAKASSDGWSALHWAAWRGHRGAVQLLVKIGADIGSKDRNERTALHLAALRGHEAVVLLLLEKGANAQAEDRDGKTALHLAVSKGHDAAAQLLKASLNPP
jgi:ankyrin repeat domain-containing protein 50